MVYSILSEDMAVMVAKVNHQAVFLRFFAVGPTKDVLMVAV